MKTTTLGALLLLAVLAENVCAEVHEFRLGHAITWLLNVVGINFLDYISALPDFIILICLLFAAIYLGKPIWKKIKKL